MRKIVSPEARWCVSGILPQKFNLGRTMFQVHVITNTESLIPGLQATSPVIEGTI
jgi:hypothetical protein